MKHNPKYKRTIAVALTLDELHHVRWALAGFHQSVETCDTVAASAAVIDEKLRGGVVGLGGVPQ